MPGKRFLFVMWEGGGNVPPQLGLARKLVRRGHGVAVLTEPSVRPDVEAAGAEFIPFSEVPHRFDRTAESDFVRDWEPRTPAGAFGRVRDRVMLGPAGRYARDTLRAVESFGPDVLAPDWLLPGAALAGERSRTPTAALVHNIYMVPEPGKPAPGFGLLPARGVPGRLRDRVMTRMFLGLFDRGLPALNAARKELGLPRVGSVVEQLDRVDRLLVLVTEAFDFTAARPNPKVRYVGPELDEPAWVEPWEAPWPADERRPLVLVSFSSTFQDQAGAVRRTVEAVRGLPIRALVTTGPSLDPTSFAAPSNVVVVRSAPHSQVMERCAAVITHAGMGTVTRALAAGVPLVCMPMGRDQGDIAARVVARGAGLKVSRGAAASRIRAAVDRVVREPSFRERAGRLAAAIADDVRAGRGVAELEAMAGVPAPRETVGAGEGAPAHRGTVVPD